MPWNDAMVRNVQRLVRLPTVMDATGLGTTSIYRRINTGLFPPPLKLARLSAWPESEIASINEAIIAGKSEAEVRELVKQLVAARSKPAPK